MSFLATFYCLKQTENLRGLCEIQLQHFRPPQKARKLCQKRVFICQVGKDKFVASAPQAPLGPLEKEAVLLTRAKSHCREGNAAPLA